MGEIDLKWLESVLRKRGDIFELTEAESVPAVSDGDNYVSTVYRVRLRARCAKGEEKRLSVILKRKLNIGIQNNDRLNDKLNRVFNKEYLVYTDVLAKIANFLPTRVRPLWAECLAFLPDRDIYLNDLKAENYRLSDRLRGLDADHSSLVFQNLAYIHAASYAAIDAGLVDVGPFEKYLIIGAAPEVKKIKSNAYAMMVDVIAKEWGSEWKTVAERLETVCTSLPQKILDESASEKSEISVFCHGDPWVNNVMFKYGTDGKPSSVRFIDFQMAHYNSFAYDISYFLNTSVHPRLRNKHLDDWIDTYSQCFSACLNQLGCALPPPTPHLVRKELLRLTAFSLNVSLRIRPLVMVPVQDSIPISEVFEDTGLYSRKRKLYTNPEYTDVMRSDISCLVSSLYESDISHGVFN